MKSLVFILVYIVSLSTVLALWNLLGFVVVWITKKISPKRYFLGDVIKMTFLIMNFAWIISWCYLFIHLKVRFLA